MSADNVSIVACAYYKGEVGSQTIALHVVEDPVGPPHWPWGPTSARVGEMRIAREAMRVKEFFILQNRSCRLFYLLGENSMRPFQ